MADGTVAASGLAEALKGAEPARVQRTYDSRDVGAVEVLLTPKDVHRRSRRRRFWHFGRARYPLGAAFTALADGVFAGREVFPERCAVCLGEPSTGVVYEMRGELRPGGSARFRSRDLRVVTAANWDRRWYSVPYCDAHAARADGIAFGQTFTNRRWVAFRNRDYGSEFGELNGIRPLGFVRRWWAALLAGAGLLLLLGGGIVWQVAGSDDTTDDLLVAAGFLAAGLGLLWLLSARLLAPWRAERRTGEDGPAEGPQAAGDHRDRGDGYCAHCYQPWPCPPARDTGVRRRPG